jgi:hypothetical protein
VAFSVPGPFDPDADPRVYTSKNDTFILRRKRGKLLLDVPDVDKTQPWPPHWELSSNLPASMKDNPILRCNNDAKAGSFSEDAFSVVMVSNEFRQKFLGIALNEKGELSHYHVDHEESFGRISPTLMLSSIIHPFPSNRRR